MLPLLFTPLPNISKFKRTLATYNMGCTQSKGIDEKKPSKPPAATPTPASKKEEEPIAPKDKNASSKPATSTTESTDTDNSSKNTTSASTAPTKDGTAVFEDKTATVVTASKNTEENASVAPATKPEEAVADEPETCGQSEGDKFQEAVDAVDMESTTTTTVNNSTTNGGDHQPHQEEESAVAEEADAPFTPDAPAVVGESPPKAKRVPRSPLAAARRLGNNDKQRRASNSGAENNSITSSRRGSKSEADEMDGSSKTQQKKREKMIKSGHQSTGRQGPTGRRASLGAENNTQADVYLEMVSAYERQLTNPATLDAQLDTR